MLTRRALEPVVAIAVMALIIGIFFRFYHIDLKVYSGDEVYTSLRMLGVVEADLVRHAGHLHDAHDLWLILHPTPPEGASSPFATIHALAIEEPHHPPLYYLLGHFWLHVFGNSVAAVRSLSATISLFALPLAFWLGVELFRSRAAGWIAAALFALSPVGVLYAQEAREYSLWIVVLLAISAALLRAIRLDRPRDWWLVAALVAFGLYVYPLTLLVLTGLATYVAIISWTNRALLLRCGLAFAAGILAFIPWLVILVGHLATVDRSFAIVLSDRLSPPEIARSFLGLLRLNILDFNLVHSSRFGTTLTTLAVAILIFAVAFVLRRGPKRVSLFLLLPIIAAAAPLLGADLFGGQSVRLPRYFTPVYVYLDYCIVQLILVGISAHNRGRAILAYALLAGLLVARLASSAASSQAETWWNKMEDNSIPVARVINHAQHPIMVSDNILDYSLVLANYLRPDVLIELQPRCYECLQRTEAKEDVSMFVAPRSVTDIFALGPSTKLQSFLQTTIVQRHLQATYHCINARYNCESVLHVEPNFGPATQIAPSQVSIR